MDDFYVFDDGGHDNQTNPGSLFGTESTRNTTIQILLSLALGISAFFTFCILRPRWPGLYAARKKHRNETTVLPDLPDSLFGWIRPLWRVTDQQVLASAGLDAYVFLAFFKLAIKFLVVTLFFSVIVIKPVHDAYSEDDDVGHKHNKSKHHDEAFDLRRSINLLSDSSSGNNGTRHNGTIPFLPENFETDYLWMYLVFAYLFSGIAIYLIIAETRRIIEVRQEYLGTQTTVTDRTIRLSGIPPELQDPDKIKEFIESLDIGKVESVTLCRNWKELDDAMVERMSILRRLEEAYTVHMGSRRVERNLESLPVAQPAPPMPVADAQAITSDDDEDMPLIHANGQAHVTPYAQTRPKTRVRYGWMKLRSKQVDAIDYFEEKLRQADERVKLLRKKVYEPTPLAFVTMDSVAASQMAQQAVLDPSPLQLIANPSPAPADVIWPNVYLSRRSRMARAWSITAVIILLTLLWSFLLVPIAGALNTDTIGKVFPQLAEVLRDHENIQSLVNTQLPTLTVSLLTVLVPYIYYWLSYCQGMIASGDVELSAISKNFFFTFFNFFVIFTVLGTASKFLQIFDQFGEALRDFRKVAYTLAVALQKLLSFYVNFIILQGIGLFPFRLLEVGAVSLYPLYRIGAKTPRDYAELVQPPVFSYGFYLPTALLVFIICMVYSVLNSSWQVLLAGLAYFCLGHFVYKYQLLYAMDHQQHSTGKAWEMICDRIIVGLIFFQLTTAGQLVLKRAVARSVAMVPLVMVTVWFAIAYGKTYKPLMKFIALRSVKRGEQADYVSPDPSTHEDIAVERNVWADDGANWRINRDARYGRAAHADPETGVRFINPSLVAPLEDVWIADKSFRREGESNHVDESEDNV